MGSVSDVTNPAVGYHCCPSNQHSFTTLSLECNFVVSLCSVKLSVAIVRRRWTCFLAQTAVVYVN